MDIPEILPMPRRPTAAFTPLKANALQVLLALAESETHGYGVLKRVNRAGGHRLSPSTLYALIHRLEREGLITETSWRPDVTLDDERRRYFRLTDLGKATCDAEIDRLELLVQRARAARARRPAES